MFCYILLSSFGDRLAEIIPTFDIVINIVEFIKSTAIEIRACAVDLEVVFEAC